MTETKTFELASDQVRYLEHKIASGEYLDESDVVAAGLNLLREQDGETEEVWPFLDEPEYARQLAENPDRREQMIDDWISREIVPVVEAMQADPSRGIPAKEVFDQIRALHETRKGGRGGRI